MPDLAVGLDTSVGIVFLRRDGTVRHTATFRVELLVPFPEPYYSSVATSIVRVPRVGDDRVHLAVGSYSGSPFFGTGPGLRRFVLDRQGNVLERAEYRNPPSTNFRFGLNSFGSKVAPIDDLDGDGNDELAVSAPNWRGEEPDALGTGAIFILFLDAEGQEKRRRLIPARDGLRSDPDIWEFDLVGSTGDRDGDGIADLVVRGSYRNAHWTASSRSST